MSERLPELGLGDSKPLLPTTAAPGPNVKSPDLLSKFLAAHDTRPEFMTNTLVQTMAVSMAFAGSETTAISLSAVFYFLLKNPVRLARLRAEIDDAARAGAFSDSESGLVTWHESQRLVYLDACVKEAFRLHPAPGLPMERVVPEGGIEICGRYVKGGTIVGCSAWVIHKDKRVFGEDVEAYRPERWLPDEAKSATEAGRAAEEQRIKEMNGTMLQFGVGSRTCIGKNISLLEIYKLVPSMLRRFEVCCPPPFPPTCPRLTIRNYRSSSRTPTRNGSWSTPGSSSRITSPRPSSCGTSYSPRLALLCPRSEGRPPGGTGLFDILAAPGCEFDRA